MSAKKLLRAEAKKRLASLSTTAAKENGRLVAANVWTLPEAVSAGTILLYSSLPGEVPTSEIAIAARGRGMRVAYPRALSNRHMTLHVVDAELDLLPGGSYGIREPAHDAPALSVGEIDVAFIPGLGWDRSGNRLGRGAGYYDRLLVDPTWRGFACGVFFGFQEFPSLPADSWDQTLEAVVTEREIIRIV